MKISVLTPSYNSAPFLERAIQSVLDQDYPDYEHIIVDGVSTDETISIVQRYPHILFISEKDKGQSDAMNKAFEKSTGDIVVYLNADDYFLADAFKTIVKAFESNGNATIIIGNLYIKNKEVMSESIPSIQRSKIAKYWDYTFPLNPVSYFYKRELQQHIGPFPLHKHYTMDYWFLLRAYKIGKLCKIDQYLGVFEMHENNKSSNADTLCHLKNEIITYIRETRDYKIVPEFMKSYMSYSVKKKLKKLR